MIVVALGRTQGRKLEKFWVVRDPSPFSTLEDVMFQAESPNQLARIIVGTGLRQFEAERHAFYTTEKEARQDAQKRMAAQKPVMVLLQANGNPDYDQPENMGWPTEWVEVESYEHASRVCREYIRRYNLGGGNWTGGALRQGGVDVARVSYNGRVWVKRDGQEHPLV